MANILGIGGVFLNFKGEPKDVRNWYENILKLNMSPYGTSFIEGEQLSLVSFSRTGKKTDPYINFRVDNIDELVDELKSNNVQITSEIKEFSYGKFAQFVDPFGNYIELWEPYVDEYRKMVNRENNDK